MVKKVLDFITGFTIFSLRELLTTFSILVIGVVLLVVGLSAERKHNPLAFTPYQALNVCAMMCVDDIKDIQDVRQWYYIWSETNSVICVCADGMEFESGNLTQEDIKHYEWY